MNNLIILYPQNEEEFISNNIVLNNFIKRGTVTRILHDNVFSLEIELNLNNKIWQKISNEMYIKTLTPQGEEIFKIVKTRRGMNSLFIYATHIFFSMEDNFINDTYIQGKNGTGAINQILNAGHYKSKFSGTSDIIDNKNLRIVRKNMVSALIGTDDNTFINRYGGELNVNKFNFTLNKRIGRDTDIQIRYGKNLQNIDFIEDNSNVVTRIVPIGFNGLLLPEYHIDSKNINKYQFPKIKLIKFEHIKVRTNEEEEGFNTETEAHNALREECYRLFNDKEIDRPKVNASIDFIELSKTNEYKHLSILERISLGDTVKATHEKININIKQRLIKYTYDILNEKYLTIELGEPQDNVFNTIGNLDNIIGNLGDKIESVDKDFILNEAIINATNLINAGLKNSYVIVRTNEILIMDTQDIMTAKQVFRLNNNGLGFSNNGYNGPYETAITMNGKFVINEITCNKFTAALIEAGTITAEHLTVEAKETLRDGLVTNTDFTVGLEGVKTSITSGNMSNLIRNSTGRIGTKYWLYGSINNSTVYLWEDIINNARSEVYFDLVGRRGSTGGIMTYSFYVKENTKYSLSVNNITVVNGNNLKVKLLENTLEDNKFNVTNAKMIGTFNNNGFNKLQFTTSSGTKFIKILFEGEVNKDSLLDTEARYTIKELRLNEGENSYSWSDSSMFSESIQEHTIKSINSKVSNTDFESYKTQMADKFKQVVASKDFDEFKKAYTQFTQEYDKFSFEVITGGGANILYNGGFKSGDYTPKWFVTSVSSNGVNSSCTVLSENDSYCMYNTRALKIQATNETSGAYGIRQHIKLKSNTNYTLSGYTAGVNAKGQVLISDKGWNVLGSVRLESNTHTGGKDKKNWQYFSFTFKTGLNSSLLSECHVDLMLNDSTDEGKRFFTNIMVNEGDLARAWQGHAEEVQNVYVDITNEGLTVKNGAIKVKNNAGEEVVKADVNGNVDIQGKFTSRGNNDRVEIFGNNFCTYYQNFRNIELNRYAMKFFDWEGKNNTLSEIHSTYSINDSSNRGLTIESVFGNYVSFVKGHKNNNRINVFSMNDGYNPGGKTEDIIIGGSTNFTGHNLNEVYFVNYKASKSVCIEGLRLYDNDVEPNYTGNRIWLAWARGTLCDNNYTETHIGDGQGRSNYGKLYALNVKSIENPVTINDTETYGYIDTSSYNLTENYLGDVGAGHTKNGECIIFLDDAYIEMVDTNVNYHVYISKEGPGDIWISEKSYNYFKVKSTNDIRFSFEIKAKRRGFKHERLTSSEFTKEKHKDNYINEYCKTEIKDITKRFNVIDETNITNIFEDINNLDNINHEYINNILYPNIDELIN